MAHGLFKLTLLLLLAVHDDMIFTYKTNVDVIKEVEKLFETKLETVVAIE
jgi:hypothetical protein